MPVIINYKICDNALECGGPEVCPTGAFTWDEEDQTLKIDNSKCTSCGLCAKECPTEAIIVVKTEDEYEKIKKEIEEDPRTKAELFIERYGAKVTNAQVAANSYRKRIQCALLTTY